MFNLFKAKENPNDRRVIVRSHKNNHDTSISNLFNMSDAAQEAFICMFIDRLKEENPIMYNFLKSKV